MTTDEAFRIARGLAVLSGTELRTTRWSTCSLIEADHRQTPRFFCHVFHVPGFVCIAEDFEQLSDSFQLGILLHEFGHLATASEWDDHADAWVKEVLGIPLEYKESLEWVAIEDVENAYRRFT